MIIKGTPVDHDVIQVQKSIAANLQNKDLFQSENVDTAENGTELKPPISMRDCLYVFKNSAHVAKSCRILSSDIICNDISNMMRNTLCSITYNNDIMFMSKFNNLLNWSNISHYIGYDRY